MRYSILAAILAASSLAACMGPEGNPNGAPYANEPGGSIAVQPQFVSNDSYDPYAKAQPFADMQMGGAAVTPSPTPPLNLSTQGASPTPANPPPPPR